MTSSRRRDVVVSDDVFGALRVLFRRDFRVFGIRVH